MSVENSLAIGNTKINQAANERTSVGAEFVSFSGQAVDRYLMTILIQAVSKLFHENLFRKYRRAIGFFVGLLLYFVTSHPVMAIDYLPTTPLDNFRSAKRVARATIYRDRSKTQYCSCSFTNMGISGGRIDIWSCGYSVRKSLERAARLEWDHVVPANDFKRLFECGQTGGIACNQPGRHCCQRTSTEFVHLEADLHNIVPSVGEINADKDILHFGIIPGERREYGQCDFERQKKIVEPADSIRGDLARIWLYMHEIRGVPLSLRELKLYLQWHRIDPPDALELERDRRIKSIQGNTNPFVSIPGFAD